MSTGFYSPQKLYFETDEDARSFFNEASNVFKKDVLVYTGEGNIFKVVDHKLIKLDLHEIIYVFDTLKDAKDPHSNTIIPINSIMAKNGVNWIYIKESNQFCFLENVIDDGAWVYKFDFYTNDDMSLYHGTVPSFKSENHCINYFDQQYNLFYDGITVIINDKRAYLSKSETGDIIVNGLYKEKDSYQPPQLSILKYLLNNGNSGGEMPSSIRFEDEEYMFIKDESEKYICVKKINL